MSEYTPYKIPIDLVDDPRIAMRETTKDDSIEELKADMAAEGLIEPIVVRRNGERYELIAGHRRTTAARLLGWASIEAKVVEVDDKTALSMRAMENLSRRNVDPVDEAAYIGEIMVREHLDAAGIAEMIHRSKEWVEIRLAVFDMPEYLKAHLKSRQVSLGAALELMKIKDENTRRYYSNYAAVHGSSKNAVMQWVVSANAEPAFSQERMQEIAQTTPNFQPERKVIQCHRCGGPEYLDRAISVFIHSGDCEPGTPGGLSQD